MKLDLRKITDWSAYGNLTKLPAVLEAQPEWGKISPLFFDGGNVTVARLEAAMCTDSGVVKDGYLIAESCLLGLNPNMLADSDDYLAKAKVGSIADISLPAASYCINKWDFNYQHFLVETLPKIHCAAHICSAPIIVADHGHIREILSISYPDRKFVYLNAGTTVAVEQLVLPLPIARNFEPVRELQVAALRQLRQKVGFPVQRNPEQVAYMGRITVDGLAGQHRQAVNNNDAINVIQSHGVHIHDFMGKSLAEKCWITSSYAHQITPIGANIMNYLFATNDVQLHVIDHPYFKNHEYFSNLLKQVGSPVTYNILGIATKASEPHDWSGNLNSPYAIDIDGLQQFLSGLQPKLRA